MVSIDGKRLPPEARPAAEVYERAAAGDDFALTDSIGYLVRDAHRVFLRAMQMRVSDTEITMGMMEPTTVTALRLMERRGLVYRERDTSDRRRSLVYLTDRGRALRAELLPLAAETNLVAIAGLNSGEILNLRRMLTAVIANLDRDVASRGADPGLVEDDIADHDP